MFTNSVNENIKYIIIKDDSAGVWDIDNGLSESEFKITFRLNTMLVLELKPTI